MAAALLGMAVISIGAAWLSSGGSHASPADPLATRSANAKLPLTFVPNAGQTNKQVRYYAQGSGFSFYFTRDKAVLALAKGKRQTVLDLGFVGASPHARLVAGRPGPGTVNYMKGSDRSKWRTGLRTYRDVVYRDLWPGIDMVFKGANGSLAYEFLVRPGAHPSDIRLAYGGSKRLSLSSSGDLLIDTQLGTLSDHRPQTYQRIGARRVTLPSRFALDSRAATLGFTVPRYDRRHALVIDPSLAYSTFLGGSGNDHGQAIAVDGSGNAYVTGYTTSTNFPTTPGAPQTSFRGGWDVFVTKLNATGSALVYSTYLGGSQISGGAQGLDKGQGIAVDGAGSAYVTGSTTSCDFPTTPGAFQTNAPNPWCFSTPFVTKLSASGSALAYSTYLGGSSYGTYMQGNGIAVDGGGNAYVTGAASTGFPTTPGAFQTSSGGAFVTKLNPAGSALVYSTRLGGTGGDSGNAIALDGAGNAYVTGATLSHDFPTTPGAFQSLNNNYWNGTGFGANAFVTELNATGSALAYSTYLGGSGFGKGGGDGGKGIALDGGDNAYVTGYTDSFDFPTTPGAFQTGNGNAGVDGNTFTGFVTKLNPSGTALVYSTYLGGSTDELVSGIALDGAGEAYVAGQSYSTDFPVTPDAFQHCMAGPDAFLTKLNAAGSALVYSSCLGADSIDSGGGVAVDSAGSAYLTGYTQSSSFPTIPGASQPSIGGGTSDAFVAKFNFFQTYARPKGASPLRAPLVPAYKACSAPTSTHGAPLAFASCNPPVQESSFLTVGTPDANGASGSAVGSVVYTVQVNAPPTQNDVLINVSTTDVRCQPPVNTTCGTPNTAAGPDYTGELLARTVLRITDRDYSPTDTGTTQNNPVPVTVPCAATASPAIGSTCAVATSFNAVVPGSVKSGKRAIWQVGQVKLFDGGASGTAGAPDATVFEDEGVFVP